jgi:hypothetical protein
VATLFAVEDGSSITFDGILRESWEFSGKVTDHPVEEFDFVIDNRQRNPNTLEVEAVMTRTRFYESETFGQLVASEGLFDPLSDTKSFLELYSRISLFTYTSVRLGVVENLMIEDFSFEIDKLDRIEFKISFKEIVFATSVFVDLPPIQVRRQEPVVKECVQPAKDVPVQGPTIEAQNNERKIRSVLQRLQGSGVANFTPGEAGLTQGGFLDQLVQEIFVK